MQNYECSVLGECRCGRLQNKTMFVALSMQIIVCDDILHLYESFRK